jgi:hypothetical protein
MFYFQKPLKMKNKRREFIKLAGMAGAGIVVGPVRSQAENPQKQPHRQSFNMHGYAAPKLERVRVGLVGIGSRGSGTLNRLAAIENVDIMALCDIIPDNVQKALKSIDGYGHEPDTYTDGEDTWKALCDRNDIDLIYIATPWKYHAPIAVYAMEREKHVYTELPVGISLEECWQVVETSEKTKRHCFMGCGSCHDGMSAILLNMVRDGYFGDLIHGEGNYIHDRVNSPGRWERDEHGWFGYRPWRLKENVGRDGNLYPQHGLGPLAQMMDLNYGDQMDYLMSISSNDFTMAPKMKELAESDPYYEPYDGLKFRGNINTTLIRTHKGRTIMLQHDISSPRPGSRFQLISGSKGIYEARPPKIAVSEEWMEESEFKALVEKYTPAITKKFQQKVSEAGGIRGDRSYERVTASDWRLIDCLRNGLPLEMDVYDAALWTAVTPLSEQSVAQQGKTLKVPDFTSGAWKTNKRGMDIHLKDGGTTGLV